jgi:hypothetical protein
MNEDKEREALTVGPAVAGNLLYDVIFSVTFRVPVMRVDSGLDGVL